MQTREQHDITKFKLKAKGRGWDAFGRLARGLGGQQDVWEISRSCRMLRGCVEGIQIVWEVRKMW